VAYCPLQDTGAVNRVTRCGENHLRRAGTEPFANARVGVGREKCVADSLTCTPPQKIRLHFEGTNIHCLVKGRSGQHIDHIISEPSVRGHVAPRAKSKGINRVNNRYVVDENGERVAVLLDIENYERMVAQHHATAVVDEPPSDDEDEEVLDPEEAEHRITEFVTNADNLPGPPVAELAEDVAKLMRAAWRDVEAIMNGNPHNKVLAVELFLGQQARGLQPDNPEQWRLHAAVSLLSGIHLDKAGK
jgi:hypothetical protein